MQICGDYQNALCYMVTLDMCKFFLFALLTEKLLSLVATIQPYTTNVITAMCMDDTHRALNTHSWFGTISYFSVPLFPVHCTPECRWTTK